VAGITSGLFSVMNKFFPPFPSPSAASLSATPAERLWWRRSFSWCTFGLYRMFPLFCFSPSRRSYGVAYYYIRKFLGLLNSFFFLWSDDVPPPFSGACCYINLSCRWLHRDPQIEPTLQNLDQPNTPHKGKFNTPTYTRSRTTLGITDTKNQTPDPTLRPTKPLSQENPNQFPKNGQKATLSFGFKQTPRKQSPKSPTLNGTPGPMETNFQGDPHQNPTTQNRNKINVPTKRARTITKPKIWSPPSDTTFCTGQKFHNGEIGPNNKTKEPSNTNNQRKNKWEPPKPPTTDWTENKTGRQKREHRTQEQPSCRDTKRPPLWPPSTIYKETHHNSKNKPSIKEIHLTQPTGWRNFKPGHLPGNGPPQPLPNL